MPIRIRSKRREGFWRCGLRHSAEWTEHPDGTFSQEQIEILQAEPMLEVEIVDPKPGAKAKTREKKTEA